MSRALPLLVVAWLAACGGATRAPSPPAPSRLIAVDVYGAEPGVIDAILAAHGDALRAYGQAMIDRDAGAGDDVLAAIRDAGDFAYVEPALVAYQEDDGTDYYLTIDVVAEQDVARRMPFAPAPAGTHPDPDGLVAAWERYEQEVFARMQSGELSGQRVACPAFHCFGDPSHPALDELDDAFARVPANVDALAAILRDDHRGWYRATAAYLLAYAPDGARVVELLVGAFRDPDPLVRNNAMRVVAEIARWHPSIEVPLDPVLEALDYAVTSDRNKAAAILDGLLQRPDAARLHEPIAARAGATLRAMARLQQPNNRDFAHRILTAITTKERP